MLKNRQYNKNRSYTYGPLRSGTGPRIYMRATSNYSKYRIVTVFRPLLTILLERLVVAQALPTTTTAPESFLKRLVLVSRFVSISSTLPCDAVAGWVAYGNLVRLYTGLVRTMVPVTRNGKPPTRFDAAARRISVTYLDAAPVS